MRLAVVGHTEWVEFAKVEQVPAQGEIIHALETWEEAAGGGAVAAVQLAKLNGSVELFTAVGDDELGRRSREQLAGQGVTVHAATIPASHRRAFTYVDAGGERTITVIGPKLVASGEDGTLPWEDLARCDAVYFTGGDVAAVRAARRARLLVATSRELPTLHRAVEEVDVLIGSGEDAGERVDALELEPPARAVISTAGALGGWMRPGGPYRAVPPPGPIVDAYGCGDSFAAAVTFALAEGRSLEDAVALGARCGAAVLTGAGPYAAQLTAASLA
jgi:ribokinase